MAKPWAKGSRRGRLPKDWPARVRMVKARARGLCEADHHAPGCQGVGHEADHVVNNDDHSLANLQWLSTSCHAAKTELEREHGYLQRRLRLAHSTESSPGMAKRHPS